jgi:DNA-directed RNA polymerase subunit alpha
MSYILPDTQLLTIKQVAENGNGATFEIDPLSPGFGITLGNALRRILLSSIEGASITSIRIDGATHEFTTIPGVAEDIVALTLNMKQARVRLNEGESASLVLQKKGPGVVTMGDFKANAAVDVMNPDHVIAHLDKGGSLSMEIEVRKGRGYAPVESRRDEKLPLGTIAIDAIYSPIERVTYDVENTRVGNVTNYNKIIMTITTDGSITPQDALQTAAKIAVEHLSILAGVAMEMPSTAELETQAVDAEAPADVAEAPKKRTRKAKTETEEA